MCSIPLMSGLFFFFFVPLTFYVCRKGQLDVRELISLYPLLLPASSSFTRCHPPLHEFADLNHLAQGDQEKVLRCKRFLISYLGEVNEIKKTTLFTHKFALILQ